MQLHQKYFIIEFLRIMFMNNAIGSVIASKAIQSDQSDKVRAENSPELQRLISIDHPDPVMQVDDSVEINLLRQYISDDEKESGSTVDSFEQGDCEEKEYVEKVEADENNNNVVIIEAIEKQKHETEDSVCSGRKFKPLLARKNRNCEQHQPSGYFTSDKIHAKTVNIYNGSSLSQNFPDSPIPK